jgi:hypothetical protein
MFSALGADFVEIGWLCIMTRKPMVGRLIGSLLFSP